MIADREELRQIFGSRRRTCIEKFISRYRCTENQYLSSIIESFQGPCRPDGGRLHDVGGSAIENHNVKSQACIKSQTGGTIGEK